MAMIIGGIDPYISTYNRTHFAAQKTVQTVITGLNHPNVAYSIDKYSAMAHLASKIGATTQSVQNTQNFSAILRTAAGATHNTVSALTQIKAHLINAANDTNDSLDRVAIQQEVNQLVLQIDDNARVQYNDKNLLDGSHGTLTFAGITGYENFDLDNLSTLVLGLTDAQGNVTINASSPEAANNSLAVIGNALNFVEGFSGGLNVALSISEALDAATTQGAQLQRLDFQEANFLTMEENQLAAQSTIGDADVAKQVADLRKEETLEQIALFAMKMFNYNRESVMGLLQ